MNLIPIYILPVGYVEAKQFIEPAREWFERVNYRKVNEGYGTSLGHYGDNLEVVDLSGIQEMPQGPEFIAAVLSAATDFTTAMGYAVKDLKLTRLWVNEMTSNGHHIRHAHYGKTISGCYYVDMPENCSGIQFETPTATQFKAPLTVKTPNHFNSPVFSLHPRPGDLCLWESHVQHFVDPTPFEGVRRSIAFDIVT